MWGLISLLLALTLARGSPLTSSPPGGGGGQGIVLDNIEDLPILVPDIGDIEAGATLGSIGAEKFLELWIVYVLAGKVVLSDEPWTLLVPLNKGLPRDSSFLFDREYTQEILFNHVILGDSIDVPSAVAAKAPYYSLADSELAFTTNGESSFVNGIRLTGDEIRSGNGVILVIEDSIPLEHTEFLQFVPLGEAGLVGSNPLGQDVVNLVDTEAGVILEGDFGRTTFENQPGGTSIEDVPSIVPEEVVGTDVTSFDSSPPTSTSSPSRPTRFEKFRSLLAKKDGHSRRSAQTTKPQTSSTNPSSSPAAEAEWEDALPQVGETGPEPTLELLEPLHAGGEAILSFGGEFEDERGEAISRTTSFVRQMLDELGVLNSNGAEFSHHFLDAQLDQFLDSSMNYTAIIPTNDAFYDYYPIDWGFNPFLVENFTKDVLLNHIMEGDISLQDINDTSEVQLQTIQGRVIKVSRDKAGTLLVNGNVVPKETEVELPNGRLYFVHRLLFVDYDRVNALREEFPFLETAPLLSFPWPTSPFLSHLLKRLHENSNATLFTHLLKNSNIAHLVSSSDENLNRLSYSAFVPTDTALKASLNVESLAVLDRKSINDFLLEHIVTGYLFEEDFEDGFNLLSLTNRAIPISMAQVETGDIFIGPAKILKPQQFVYNLGAIFMVDRPIYDLPTDLPLPNPSDNLAKNLSPAPPSEPSTEKPAATVEQLSVTGSEPLTTTMQTTTVSEEPSSAFSFLEEEEEETTGVTSLPEVTFEVRTEVSFSKQVNDGEIVPVTKEEIERAKRMTL